MITKKDFICRADIQESMLPEAEFDTYLVSVVRLREELNNLFKRIEKDDILSHDGLDYLMVEQEIKKRFGVLLEEEK